MINANYSTLPVGQPHPNAALKKLPVSVRDRMATVPMPVEYEAACKALAACESIDEGKYWSDKADALAAWAKIYKSDEAAVAARRLKLQAFRRMGQIAEELRPPAEKWTKERHAAYERDRRAGKVPPKSRNKGAHSLLIEHGFSKNVAPTILAAARAPEAEFEKLVEKGAGVIRAGLAGRGLGRCNRQLKSDAWTWLLDTRFSGPKLRDVRTAIRGRDPKDVAFLIAPGEVQQARELALELIEWLDAFEQALPKE